MQRDFGPKSYYKLKLELNYVINTLYPNDEYTKHLLNTGLRQERREGTAGLQEPIHNQLH